MPLYTSLRGAITFNKQQLEEFLDSRGIEKITFYENFQFSNYNKDSYTFIEHVWSRGDRLYKLGHQYYGDKNSYWLIALFNNKPTDADYKYGDIVYIPIESRLFYSEVVNGQ
tara:strand:+ start:107 stop:442 length:336 start_codon:yes stop_codon:yes gene_type:complete